MESLAIGLTAVCILFFILFFAWAYWPEQWMADQKRPGRPFRLREALEPVLRRLTEHPGNDHDSAKKAA